MSNFLIGLVGLVVLLAVPITVPKCDPDPIAWIKGESSFCTTSGISSHRQRCGHITRQYHGAGALSGLDEIEVYALKGERIDFTYSTAISRGDSTRIEGEADLRPRARRTERMVLQVYGAKRERDGWCHRKPDGCLRLRDSACVVRRGRHRPIVGGQPSPVPSSVAPSRIDQGGLLQGKCRGRRAILAAD